MKSDLLTTEQAAQYLKLSTGTLANWRYLKIGPKFKKINGKLIRYNVKDLNKFIKN